MKLHSFVWPVLIGAVILGGAVTVERTIGSSCPECMFFAAGASGDAAPPSGGSIAQRYLTLPGTSGNYVSCAYNAAHDVGDFDVWALVKPDDWTPSSGHDFLARWPGGATTPLRFALRPNSSGTAHIAYRNGGYNDDYSTTGTGFSDGTWGWVRGTYDASTGNIKFYTSSDGWQTPAGSVSWSQLGTTVSGSAVTVQTGNVAAEIGSRDGGTGGLWSGDVAYIRLDDGYDGAGSTVLEVDFRRIPIGTTSFTEESSNGVTCTVHGTAAIAGPDTFYMRADGTASVANSEKGAGGTCSNSANAMSISTHDAGSFSPGDVIVLCDDGGDFRDQLDPPSSGFEDSPIVYMAAPGDSVIIYGSEDRSDTGDWSDNGSNRWRTLGSTSANSDRLMIWRDGVQLNSQASLGAVDAADEYYWDATTDSVYLYGTSNPGSDASIYEVAIRGAGIQLEDVSWLHFRRVHCFGAWNSCYRFYESGLDTIRHVTIDTATINAGVGIYHEGSNNAVFLGNTYRHLTIVPGNDNFGSESFRVGIGSARSGVVNFRVDSFLVEDVNIDSATNDGIGCEWCQNSTFRRITFTGAYGENCTDFKDPVNILFEDVYCANSLDAGLLWHDEQVEDRSHDVTIRRTVVENASPDFDAAAIFIHEGYNYTMDSVVIKDAHAGAIHFSSLETGHGGHVCNRCVVDDWSLTTGGRAAIRFNSSASPTVTHSTIYADAGGFAAVEFAGTTTGTITFKNNIVLEQTDNDAGRCVHIQNSPTTAIDNNLYYHCDDSDFYYNNTGYTFANWAALGAIDEANSALDDPKLVSAGTGDLTLSVTSPAIGAAEDIGVHNDIGAFDYPDVTFGDGRIIIITDTVLVADSVTAHPDTSIIPLYGFIGNTRRNGGKIMLLTYDTIAGAAAYTLDSATAFDSASAYGFSPSDTIRTISVQGEP